MTEVFVELPLASPGSANDIGDSRDIPPSQVVSCTIKIIIPSKPNKNKPAAQVAGADPS